MRSKFLHAPVENAELPIGALARAGRPRVMTHLGLSGSRTGAQTQNPRILTDDLQTIYSPDRSRTSKAGSKRSISETTGLASCSVIRSVMASTAAAMPLLRRELRQPLSSFVSRPSRSFSTAPARVRGPCGSLAAISKCNSRRSTLARPSYPRAQIRYFSRSSVVAFSDEHGNFDPRQVERESDEVDVCIVGGGTSNLPCLSRRKSKERAEFG